MALKYPAFDRTVWNFVKPDLSIVDTYLQYQESKAKVNSLTVERNAKAMKERTDVSYLVEDVMDAAKRINWYEKTDAKRQDGLRIGLKKYQELKSTPYSSPVIRHELAKVVEEIARSYFMFQVNKLRDDVAKCIESEAAVEESLKKELQRLHGKIVAENEKLKTILHSVSKCCVQDRIPEQVKGFRSAKGKDAKTQAEAERNYAEFVLNGFVDDWRERAAMFTVPVTITGVAIHTLPKDKRGVWYSAFEKLGFLDLVNTKPVYQWIQSTEGDGPRKHDIGFRSMKD